MQTKNFIRLKTLIFVISLFCFSNLTQAEKQTSENHAKGAHNFFTQYLINLNRLISEPENKDALLESAKDMSYPSILISAKGNQLVANDESFLMKSNTSFAKYLSRQGVDKINWEQISLQPLGEKTFIASNIANLINQQGEIMQRISSTYLIHFRNGQWRIFSRIQHPVTDRIQALSINFPYLGKEH